MIGPFRRDLIKCYWLNFILKKTGSGSARRQISGNVIILLILFILKTLFFLKNIFLLFSSMDPEHERSMISRSCFLILFLTMILNSFPFLPNGFPLQTRFINCGHNFYLNRDLFGLPIWLRSQNGITQSFSTNLEFIRSRNPRRSGDLSERRLQTGRLSSDR